MAGMLRSTRKIKVTQIPGTFARPEFRAYFTATFHFYFQQPSSRQDVWFSRRKVTKANNNVIRVLKTFSSLTVKKTPAAVLLAGMRRHHTQRELPESNCKQFGGNVRFEVFTAVIMKNDVFCDKRIEIIPHRRHITSRLQTTAG
jgi:hypothetical protein